MQFMLISLLETTGLLTKHGTREHSLENFLSEPTSFFSKISLTLMVMVRMTFQLLLPLKDSQPLTKAGALSLETGLSLSLKKSGYDQPSNGTLRP
jgi:hypothetical protein